MRVKVEYTVEVPDPCFVGLAARSGEGVATVEEMAAYLKENGTSAIDDLWDEGDSYD